MTLCDDSKRQKGEAVNKLLVDICVQREIPLIDHGNINMKRHLNKSRLHLNAHSKSIFVRNLKFFLKKFNWRSIWDNWDKVKSSPLFDPEINSLSDVTSIKLQQKVNYKNLIIGHLNINSVRNIFEMIEEIIKNFDIFLISESKLDST